MRIAIIGSRGFPAPHMVVEAVRYFQETIPGWILVSGGARGVDSWAEAEAKRLCISCEILPADWSLGRGAGLIRNREIVGRSEIVVAFWDSISRGTKYSIDLARAQGKIVWIIDPV